MTDHRSPITIGVLALQGDFQEHIAVLDRLQVKAIQVRSLDDLSQCDAIILPGGESTVMMKLLKEFGLDRELFHQIKSGMSVLATCAGAILLSDSHLNLMDITVDRNAYGSQLQSFEAVLTTPGGDVQASFIRAPKITRTGDGVVVLAAYGDDPVLVRQGSMIAATFHPEVHGQMAVHKLFLDSIGALIK